MINFPDGWLLNRKDIELLSDLRDEIWSWRRQTQDPYTLMGVSAMTWEIDQIIAREEVGNVLTLVFDTYHFVEGRRAGSEVCVSISSEGLELRYGSAEFGDHSERIVALLSPDGGFVERDIEEWLSLKSEVSGQLSANIDGLQVGV